MEPHDRPAARVRLAWPLLALAAVAALLLRAGLEPGKVLLPLDSLYQFEPWRSAADVDPANPLLLDQAIVIAPWLDFAAERLRAGELPLWNPFNYGGQPIVGAYQLALWWPPNWVYFATQSAWFFVGVAWLKLVAAGAFMLLYLARLGLARGPASVGALAFMLCGFNLVWLGHNQTNVALFAPLCLWCVERAAQGVRARHVGLFAFVVALQFCAGHAQTSAHLLAVVAAYALFRWRVEVGGSRLAGAGLARLALGAALGTLLAAPQLLPFLEYLRDSQGLVSNASPELVARDGAWKGLALLALPKLFGTPQDGDYHGPLGAHLNYAELVGGYVGALMLALAAAGVLVGRGRGRWFFVGLLAFALCLAYQLAPVYDALRALPLWGATKLMRFALFVALALAVLGAFGLDALAARLRRAGGLVAAVFLLVALELCAFGERFNPAVDPGLARPRTPLTDFLTERRRAEPPFTILPVDSRLLIANANLFYGLPVLTGYDSLELARMTELVRCLSSDPRGALFAQEIRWFDRPLPLGDLLGLRYLLSREPLPAPFELVLDGPCKVYANPRALPPVFLADRVELVEDAGLRLARLASPDFDPRVALLEHAPPQELPRSARPPANGAPPQDTLELRAHDVRSLAFDASLSSPRLVVIPAAWAPGWRASANGIAVPVERVDHALRGVWLGPGRWQVELRYQPSSTRIGLWIGGAAFVMLLALLLRRESRA